MPSTFKQIIALAANKFRVFTQHQIILILIHVMIDLKMHQGFNRIVLTLIRDFNSWLVFSIVKNMPFEFLLWNVIA